MVSAELKCEFIYLLVFLVYYATGNLCVCFASCCFFLAHKRQRTHKLL